MAQKKRRTKVIIVFVIFIVYFFIAARPVPRETILAQKWISSLNSMHIPAENEPIRLSEQLVPFTLGAHFGYVNLFGQFELNRIMADNVYLDRNMWAEYGAQPASIVVNNISENTQITVENAWGYPVLLDNRVFILGSEQNSLSEIGNDGNVLWTYEFGAPITCIDVAAGLVVTGSLDGAVEVFNSSGERIYYFEPDGSRYSVILGCAISRNGSRIAVISGIDQQRFLLLERLGSSGGEYRVVHHEFLETGFRRPVHVLFVDEDRRIIFEREGGIGSFNIRSRRGIYIPLDGEIVAIDNSGDQGFLFLITSASARLLMGQEKRLVGIRFPPDRFFGSYRIAARDAIFLTAPFRSDDVFLGRIRAEGSSSILVTGGGSTLISFDLEEK